MRLTFVALTFRIAAACFTSMRGSHVMQAPLHWRPRRNCVIYFSHWRRSWVSHGTERDMTLGSRMGKGSPGLIEVVCSLCAYLAALWVPLKRG